MSLKPWREVVSPHADVLEGTFQEAEFAADLSKVAKGTATQEYQDPVLFFERTYITEGMALLLDSVVKRMTGKGGDPVIQLKTAFGGGKTHAMLSAYHLARGDKAALIGSATSKLGISNLRAEFTTFNTGDSLITTPSNPVLGEDTYPDQLGFDHMQSYFVGVEGKPSANMRANVNFNIVGNVATNPIDEIFYENTLR